MKKSLLIVALLALSGCANLKFEWAASYKTDNLVEDLRTKPAPAPVAPPADPVK